MSNEILNERAVAKSKLFFIICDTATKIINRNFNNTQLRAIVVVYSRTILCVALSKTMLKTTFHLQNYKKIISKTSDLLEFLRFFLQKVLVLFHKGKKA
ncbi:MAG: hypothetical protein Q4E41_10720 [Bacteroidales bacterium]|nr:hypothetical protein [Bacteroidales bacterium]